METKARKPPGKNAAKWNWPPILAAIAKGEDYRAVAKRFSVPEGSVRQKLSEERKRDAKVARMEGFIVSSETGEPAPLQSAIRMVKPVVENALSISQAPLPSELTEDQLLTILQDPAAFLALKPEDAEIAIGKRIQGMLGAALLDPPEARTLKDVATLHKMFRDANGLTSDKAKGGNGLLSPPRAFGRRMVQEAIEVGGVVESEIEPDGGWPEGM